MTMNPTHDLKGRVFGRLRVLGVSPEQTSRQGTKWVCECSCGNVKTIARTNLISGKTQSCGCLHLDINSATGKKRMNGGGHFFGNKNLSVKTQLYMTRGRKSAPVTLAPVKFSGEKP